MTKRILAMVLAVAIAAMALPVFAFAATGVTYYDYDPSTKSLVEKTLPAGTTVTTITTGDTEDDIMPGWNLIVGNVTIPNYFFLLGEVNFILADGATLTTEGIGVELAENNGSFTIYAQSTGENMGQIVTTGCENAAGIGGGYCEEVGDIAIFGGIINVVGGAGGAGIGSGAGGSCGNISIYGGIINATGGEGGAGIGSGLGSAGSESACENIAIQGGIVNAEGGDGGAGIGCGDGGSCANISIYGDIINATGGDGGAGIGSGVGSESSCENIVIKRGVVNAVGGSDSAGLGCGDGGSCNNVTVADGYVKAVAGGETVDPISHLVTSRVATLVEEENAQYVNYAPVAAVGATCTTAGHAAYVIDYINALYYTEFPPFTTDGLIGNESALSTWDGYEPPLGHDYVCGKEKHTCTRCDLDEDHNDYNGDYICIACHAELLDDAKYDKRWMLQVLAKDRSAAVQSIANDYREQIQKATTVADVLDLYETAYDAIREQIRAEEAEKLSLAKTNAKQVLANAAAEDSSEAMSGVLEAAIAAVNDAETLEAVDKAKEEGLAAIALQFAKDSAILELTLSAGTDVTEEMAAVLDEAIAAVNDATTEEGVDGAKTAGLAAIAFQKEKDAAIAELKAIVGENPSAMVAAGFASAKATINALTNMEEIAPVKEALAAALTALMKTEDAERLADAKAAAKEELTALASKTVYADTQTIVSDACAAVDLATTVDEVALAKENGISAVLQATKEVYLPECEMILASDEYSEEVKALVCEFMEALNAAESLDEIEYAFYAYAPAINLQAARDMWLAELEALLPEMPSDAVKRIIEDAEELILYGEDSSVFDNVFDIARLAIDRQLTAEADIKAMENFLIQAREDIATANEMIDELNNTITGKEATIAEKQAALDTATEQLNAARADLETAKTNLETAKTNLETAKAHIEELEGTVSEQDEALKQAAQDLKKAQEALAQDERDIQDLQAEIERLKALLDDDPTEPTATEPTATEPTATEPTATGAEEMMLGDANEDGAVNMKDVLLMRKYLAEMDVTYSAQNADVNADGEVNMKDVLMLRKYLADMIDHLGA